jgi:hypothetical protein
MVTCSLSGPVWLERPQEKWVEQKKQEKAELHMEET